MVGGSPWDYSLSESLGMTRWFFTLLLNTRQQRDLPNGIDWHDRAWPRRVRGPPPQRLSRIDHSSPACFRFGVRREECFDPELLKRDVLRRPQSHDGAEE